LLLLALLLAGACAGAALADRAGAGREQGRGVAREPPVDFFGVNAQWVHILTIRDQHRAVRRHAAAMKRLGVEIARVSPQWNEVEEHGPVGDWGTHRFGQFDRTMRALAQSGVRASFYLIGAPAWARAERGAKCGDRHPPPDRPGPFASYAAAIVQRYGREGTFWRQHPGVPYLPVRQFEVWNEPNWWDYWCPRISPRQYADLFTAAARSIHGADPRAEVVLGGLVATNRTTYWPDGAMHGMETGRFLSEMLEHRPGARAHIDGLGLHTYGDYPWIHRNLIRYARRRMAKVGLGAVPIHHNEFGWSTSGERGFITSERERGAYIRKVISFAASSDCGVVSVAPYAWATREELSQDAEDWFGIVRLRSARPYRTAKVYSRVSRLFRGTLAKPVPETINACR
jgi:hypothetical protein